MKLQFSDLIKRYPQLAHLEADIVQVINILEDTFREDKKLLTVGNGGSSADAEHLCGELQKGFLLKRPLSESDKSMFKNSELANKLQGGFSAISLSTMHASISAFSNDVDPLLAHAQQVWSLGKRDDTLIAFSTSGNSKNICHALEVANTKNLNTIAFTGSKESECSKLADLTIMAPSTITHEVQEMHLPIYHAICIEIERRFFNS